MPLAVRVRGPDPARPRRVLAATHRALLGELLSDRARRSSSCSRRPRRPSPLLPARAVRPGRVRDRDRVRARRPRDAVRARRRRRRRARGGGDAPPQRSRPRARRSVGMRRGRPPRPPTRRSGGGVDTLVLFVGYARSPPPRARVLDSHPDVVLRNEHHLLQFAEAGRARVAPRRLRPRLLRRARQERPARRAARADHAHAARRGREEGPPHDRALPARL